MLAVVLKAEGSTPGRAGAKAIFDGQGLLAGTIGGGWVEADVQRRARETIAPGRPVVVDYDLDAAAAGEGGPICGGSMRVLIDPTAAGHCAAYEAAAEMRRRRQRGALLTTVCGPKEWKVTASCVSEQAIAAQLGFPGAETVRSVLAREEVRLFVSEPGPADERREVLVESLSPRPVLLIVGGGHVGQAVAAQASAVGFEIAVIDDRPEFAREELFPDGATTCCGGIAEEAARFPLGADTYVVIVTHGHQHDAEALAACLGGPAAYLGMIGSRRKVAMMQKDFIESGRATAADFDRVYAPIGLDIGAVTVPEIATSIVAQLIAVRRQGTAPRIALG